ncbi:hypothetical protein K491DRAFT_711474 [Lophiostoma macrostomum CBS 122681]|uniref:C2H2-type domain-containing protein n=1 Tax=Lophiostoma macrostomum CBS 122681 TaxID=1314788 RepID=A0A6A6TNX3_9PLEO|nr:hypothetical protein K491DRAFT_711474 [Lophiostoma macrostomum CBS 122681]
MEAVTWSEFHYKPAARLPQLVVKEVSRRDSITSSRTGDSGYNSDPEISHSPVDLGDPDNRLELLRIECPILRATSASATLNPSVIDIDGRVASAWAGRMPQGNYGSILLKKAGDCLLASKIVRPQVTSNPTTSDPFPATEKLDWTNAFKDTSKSNLPETATNAESREQGSLTSKKEVELWIDEAIPSHDRPKERVSSIVSLSSTGSGGDYTITDDSEGDEAFEDTPSMLSKATLKTIELIIRKVELNLRYAAYNQCAGGQHGRGNSVGGPSGGRRGSVQGLGGKRKALGGDDSPPDDQDETNPNKRRRTSITTTEDSESGPRFACPFYKHDPMRYRNRRTCPGPGWPTVHRMKEHLYRSHAQPIYCPRCYSMFDADSDLANHLRSNPCAMSASQPIDGIDRETLQNLRKRSPPLRLEEDKWRDTYHLLFPEVPEADIPSPYYENDSPTEESRRFRRVLLQRIQQELFTTAERETGDVEQDLLRRVASIIRRCEDELLNSFQLASSPLVPLPTPGFSTITQPSSNIPRNHLAPPRNSQSSSMPRNQTTSAPSALSHSIVPQLRERARPRVEYAMAEDLSQSTFDAQSQTPLPWQESPSEWIDWNSVFAPGPGTQITEHDDSLQPPLAMPVWT